MQAQQQYIDLFDSSRDIIFSHSAEAMNACRDAASDAFRKIGLPSRRVEEYRYTDLQKLFAPDYGVNLKRLPVHVNPYEEFKCFVPNLSSSLFFVVNDIVCPPVRQKSPLPDGVIIDSFANVEKTRPELLRGYYNRLATNKESVCALNTMLAQDGMLVYVPRNVTVDRPVQIINVLHSAVDLMANRRVLVVLEENASLQLLLCDHSNTDVEFLSTQVAEIFVGANASLDITCMEETNTKNRLASVTFIEQQATSRVSHNKITLHNGISRSQLEVAMRGEGAECTLSGCAILDKRQHVDNNTLIDHAAAHCDSRELYKYVLNDASTGAFAGRILVREGSQKTNASMTNQNLCATKDARMYTQPILEIYADDVKCSHGATVGQISDASLFYMRQRGILEQEAKTLLQLAFVGEVIDNVRLLPVRNRLHYLVEKRFRGELSKCMGCELCK